MLWYHVKRTWACSRPLQIAAVVSVAWLGFAAIAGNGGANLGGGGPPSITPAGAISSVVQKVGGYVAPGLPSAASTATASVNAADKAAAQFIDASPNLPARVGRTADKAVGVLEKGVDTADKTFDAADRAFSYGADALDRFLGRPPVSPRTAPGVAGPQSPSKAP